jgi:hypothetical protein
MTEFVSPASALVSSARNGKANCEYSLVRQRNQDNTHPTWRVDLLENVDGEEGNLLVGQRLQWVLEKIQRVSGDVVEAR